MRIVPRSTAAVAKTAAALLALIALFTPSLASCSDDTEDPVSVRERMDLFIADAEAGDWAGLRAHTYRGAAQYPTADAAFWQAAFGAEDFADSVPVYSGRVAVVEAAADTYTFVFRANGDGDYVVAEITRSSDGAYIYR